MNHHQQIKEQVEKAYYANQLSQTGMSDPSSVHLGGLGSGAIGLAQAQPKQPGLQARTEELLNYLSRLGANQSIMREKLFGEGQEKCVVGSQHDANGALESLLAMACQSAASLVGESEGILKRL